MNILQGMLRALVIIARDMFIGTIFGFMAAILLVKINPHTQNYAALLVPIGILTGILKGFTKHLMLNFYCMLPTKGYRLNYPKFKLLYLWLVLLLTTLLYSYGLNVKSWFTAPADLFRNNDVLSFFSPGTWITIFTVFSVIGIASYIYEPPYNEEEILPPEQDEKQ